MAVGCGILPTLKPYFEVSDTLPRSLQRHPRLDAWIQLLPDGRVRAMTGKIELGQGITTVIKQIAAEELNLPPDMIDVIMAHTGVTPNEGYTAGSGSVKGSAMAMRYAAAAAREKITSMAASKYKTGEDDIHLKDGFILIDGLAKKIPYSDVWDEASWQEEINRIPVLKNKSDYLYVGKNIPLEQSTKIIKGDPYFIHDLQFPNMLYARVIRPPSADALVDRDLLNKLLEAANELEWMVDGNFIAAVGKDTFTVINDSRSIERKLKWLEKDFVSTTGLKSVLPSLSDDQKEVKSTETENANKNKPVTAEGSFYKPYIMHGSIGPTAAIASYNEGRLNVWTHSQGVYPLRSALSSLLDMPIDHIHVIGVPGPGCFGHNCSDDAAADAAIIALRYPGKHIKVQWTREDENRWEALGCAMRMDVKASCDQAGMLNSWDTEVWTDSHSTRPNQDAGTLLPARTTASPTKLQGRGYLGGGYRNADPYYQVPQQSISAHYYQGPLRVSSLRSLGAYANIFAIESIMDDLASQLQMDPVDFRIQNLADDRARNVLTELREMTTSQKNQNEGLGFSFSRYKNNDAYCAVSAKVQINSRGEVELKNLWAVIDAGEVINPNGLEAQTEGAMLQAASWTLLEEVKAEDGKVKTLNFTSYPMLKMKATPQVEVKIIDRPDLPPHGGGEAATPPTPAAITNAIFDACGQRIYDLPVVDQLKGR